MGALEQHLVTEKVSISHDNYICRTWYSRQGTRNLLREYPQLRKLSVFDCFFFFFFFDENHTKGKSLQKECSNSAAV